MKNELLDVFAGFLMFVAFLLIVSSYSQAESKKEIQNPDNANKEAVLTEEIRLKKPYQPVFKR